MIQTEYIRSLHSNYERICLENDFQEHKYQYAMLSRGGIKGLLPCDLRYVNGTAYLYYDITSKQNISLLYQKDSINREWFLDFFWSVKHIRDELGRFLLQESNVLWVPEQIYQDLEKNIFSFLYVPYYEGENQFLTLLGFLVEHIDYSDEKLVELVYHIYEQSEKNGEVYLQNQIFEDIKHFEENSFIKMAEITGEKPEERLPSGEELVETGMEENNINPSGTEKQVPEKKSLLARFERKKGKGKEKENPFQKQSSWEESGYSYAVAEDSDYNEEEYGQTVYLEPHRDQKKILHKIYSSDGKILVSVDREVLLIGKNRDKVDIYLEDLSVSRLHGRIVKTKENVICLEDLNSTNGTFLNGNRMQPYERRALEPGDEIMCGKVVLQYR
ncbi:MAG: DUF6382 domain-containing protein [Acetatifactor sp.]